MNQDTDKILVGIAGLGAIGRSVCKYLMEHRDKYQLCGICTRSHKKAQGFLEQINAAAPLTSPEDLADRADVIIEAVPGEAFRDVVMPAIAKGCTIITVSGGAILKNADMVAAAEQSGARLILATGALLGLDAVRAAAVGTINSVEMVTRKPPASLRTAPYLIENDISVDNLAQAKLLFDGSALNGCELFPANVNVAAALSLAGIGPTETHLQIWADPAVDRNTHNIIVDADSARFNMTIENVPTQENPATGKITANSVLAALNGLTAPLHVGS